MLKSRNYPLLKVGPMSYLIFRFFALCSDPEAAIRIDTAVRDRLADFSPVSTMTPKQYWKIEEYYEFSYDLRPADSTSFDTLRQLCGGEWDENGDTAHRSSVWNRTDGIALVEQIMWIELILGED